MLNQLELTTAEMHLLQDLLTDRLEEVEMRLNQLNRDWVRGEEVPGGAKRIESLQRRRTLLTGIVNKGYAILDTFNT
jgi:hypothetical protein